MLTVRSSRCSQKSWEMSDDGTQPHLHLRQGVTFHNGDAFDSADVLYSYNNFAGLDATRLSPPTMRLWRAWKPPTSTPLWCTSPSPPPPSFP